MVERTMQPAQLEKHALASDWRPIYVAFAKMNPSQFAGYLDFARKKLAADDWDLQELGATIFRHYAKPISPKDVRLLTGIIAKPGNKFARYSAGFALWNCGYRPEEVRVVLEEARGCEDVADIANGLLAAVG